MTELQAFCERLSFPEEYTIALTGAITRLGEELSATVSGFLADPRRSAADATAALAASADALGIHPYTRDAAFVLLAFFCQKEEFIRECGEEVYYDTAKDLLWKLRECHTRYGIVGTVAIGWYNILLRRKLLTLGRLQFHTVAYPEDYEGKHISIKKGDLVIKTHIPSSGKLTPEMCLDSFRRAYRFFRPQFSSDIIPIYCASWMLDPAIAAAVEGGGIAAFASCFTIFKVKDDPKNDDLWRIFGTDPADPTALPRGNRLQCALAERLAAGGCMAIGFGMIAHDGEQILR